MKRMPPMNVLALLLSMPGAPSLAPESEPEPDSARARRRDQRRDRSWAPPSKAESEKLEAEALARRLARNPHEAARYAAAEAKRARKAAKRR